MTCSILHSALGAPACSGHASTPSTSDAGDVSAQPFAGLLEQAAAAPLFAPWPQSGGDTKAAPSRLPATSNTQPIERNRRRDGRQRSRD